ncbi:MAG TPA: phage major capsid protein [Coriobacteriia bacterium]|nr:phage major capsid protein [Coriobacteriia bacterium]
MASRYLALRQREHEIAAEAGQLNLETPEGVARLDALQAEKQEVSAALLIEEKRRELERTAPAVERSPIQSSHDRAEDRPWDSFGHFLQAVATAGTPGGAHDPRLYAAASGANVANSADGGFLVRTEWSSDLLNKATQAATLAPLCQTITLGDGADSLEAPVVDETSRATGSRWGGVQVYRRAEADTVTAARPKFGIWELRVEDMMGLAYATDRALRDAQSLGQVFADAFTDEFAFKLDDEIYRGTGAGQCLGVLNSGALVTVAAEAGQAAATVVTENLSKMWARLSLRSRARSVWVYNVDVEPQLDQLAMAVGTGALEPRFVSFGPDSVTRIKGRPMLPLEQAATLGTVGDIALLDLSQYILIRKGGIDAQESMHVRFIYGERTFRWTQSIIGKPKLASPLTPYQGASTTSPFVVLATR